MAGHWPEGAGVRPLRGVIVLQLDLTNAPGRTPPQRPGVERDAVVQRLSCDASNE